MINFFQEFKKDIEFYAENYEKILPPSVGSPQSLKDVDSDKAQLTLKVNFASARIFSKAVVLSGVAFGFVSLTLTGINQRLVTNLTGILLFVLGTDLCKILQRVDEQKNGVFVKFVTKAFNVANSFIGNDNAKIATPLDVNGLIQDTNLFFWKSTARFWVPPIENLFQMKAIDLKATSKDTEKA